MTGSWLLTRNRAPSWHMLCPLLPILARLPGLKSETLGVHALGELLMWILSS